MSGAVVGVGASRGCPPTELEALVEAGLAAAGVAPEQVHVLASVDVKGDEPAILALAAAHGWTLRLFPAPQLAGVPVPTPSATVARHVGTPSVAEAAALLAAGARAELVLAKQRSAHATVAVALPPARRSRPQAPRRVEGRLVVAMRPLVVPRRPGVEEEHSR
jgi:cobalamin biosynthesis protein CbiG